MSNRYFIMTVIKSLCLVGVVASLTACASKTYQVTEYRLPHLNDSAEALCHVDQRPVFVGGSASKAGLLLQVSETRWHSARHHRWSTPLSHQLQRSAQRLLLADNCEGKLTIWVDDFYGSNDARAVIAGHWHYQSQDDSVVLEGTFTEKVPLKSDGYPALVNSLDKGWLNVMDIISLSVSQKLAR